MNSNINYDRACKLAELAIGSERSFSACADLETPAKRLLFKMAFDNGYTWAEQSDGIGFDFNFINKAVCEASMYVDNHYNKYRKEEDKDKRDPGLETTLLGGFMFGVYEFVNNRLDNGK